MDEVDKIVLTSLNEIGYTAKENITNLKLYSFEELVSMVICCLRAIRPEAGFPTSLPPIMSARYNICAQFAQVTKDLGYKREVGYHTFMYNSITDIRNVLLFLVEHLPKKSSFEECEDQGQNVTTRQKISEELKNVFTSGTESQPSSMCKLPFVSVFLETGTLLPNQKIDCKPLEWRDFVARDLPFIDEQLPDTRCLLPSVISLNSSGLINPTKSKCSKFNLSTIDSNIYKSLSLHSGVQNEYEPRTSGMTSQAMMSKSPRGDLQMGDHMKGEDTDSEESSALSPSLTEDDEIVNDLQQEINAIKLEINTLRTKLDDVTQDTENAKKKLQEKMSNESSLQQSITLLPESENNIPKLEAANEKCRAKLSNLEGQWQRHKELLLNRKKDLQVVVDHKTCEKDELLQTITEVRKNLFDVVQEIQKRTTVEQRLRETGVGSEVQRSEFITRILDMIRNIKKQGSQIENVLRDMKCVQKEINNLSGKVGRSFDVAEHMISSNSDELSRETHKLIVTLHKDVTEIITTIDETGKYERDVKDLEDQCRDNSNNVEEALKQVIGDLKRLKKEQSILVNEITKYNELDEDDQMSIASCRILPKSLQIDKEKRTSSKSGIVKLGESNDSKQNASSVMPLIMPLQLSYISPSPSISSNEEDDGSPEETESYARRTDSATSSQDTSAETNLDEQPQQKNDRQLDNDVSLEKAQSRCENDDESV